MIRLKTKELYAWKERKNRKPLILQGARQVGKTWLMRTFASEAFPKHVYVNFEDNTPLREVFTKDFDIQRILFEVSLATGVAVDDSTLLILDEIQEAPRGVTALKYFYEQRPQLPVMAAGSLLGIASNKPNSFPVGKVDFLTLNPLSFFEFLDAMGKGQFVQAIHQQQWEALGPYTSQLEDLLRQYYLVGGMPEVVQAFVDTRDVLEVRRLQQNILNAYDRDFSKHAPLPEVPRLRMVWHSIIGQLAKENKKFIYGLLKEGARAKNFELAIEWLQDAGLVYKVNSPQTLLKGNAVFTEFKGALAEQYTFQQLRLAADNLIYYWSAENSRGEIDFLVQRDERIVPIEVKAEDNLQSKSLRLFVEADNGLHGLRFSMAPYRQQDWMTNYPLYAVEAVEPIG